MQLKTLQLRAYHLTLLSRVLTRGYLKLLHDSFYTLTHYLHNEMETCQVEGPCHLQNRFKLCPPNIYCPPGLCIKGNLPDAMMLS